MATRKLKKGDKVRYWMFIKLLSPFVKNKIYEVTDVSEVPENGADWHYDVKVAGIKGWYGSEVFALHEAKIERFS